jgi:hypothetical protein
MNTYTFAVPSFSYQSSHSEFTEDLSRPARPTTRPSMPPIFSIEGFRWRTIAPSDEIAWRLFREYLDSEYDDEQKRHIISRTELEME